MAGDFKQGTFKHEVREILKQYKVAYDAAAELLIEGILQRVNDGVPVSKAVAAALKDTDFQGQYQKAVTNAIYLAACAGFGVLPENITDQAAAAIKQKLLSESWTPDEMLLSDRLHTLDVKNKAVQVIRTSMQKLQSMKEMALELYDGYASGKGIVVPAKLSQEVSKLYELALQAARGDASLVEEVRKRAQYLQNHVDALSTEGLRAAYRDFVQACCKEKLKEGVITRAARVAIQEKTRYYAERIARTEASRAWFDGYVAERQENPDIWGYRWRLSSRHPIYDQCDVCAHMDVGYGPGFYPKNKVPSIPRHPHCMCMLEDVFSWEQDGNKIQPAGARKYLDSLSDGKKMSLFGADGLEQYEAGADWQQLLRGWDGFEKPRSRLDRKDFELKDVDSNGKMKSGSEISLEQAKNRDHKIEITDIAIDKVPYMNIPGLPIAVSETIQAEHKSLLHVAKEKNNSDEVLSILTFDGSRKAVILGDEFSVDPSNDLEAQSIFMTAGRKEILYLHNHPSTNKFSLADIMTFIRYGQIGLISVVTNQGEIYLLHKTANYDYNKLKKIFGEIYLQYNVGRISHNEAVKQFLKSCSEGGVYYEKSN
jgi:hypothetical protein